MGAFSGVKKIVSGAALAQVVSIALVPITTMLYEPESLGVFGSYFAIVSILSGTLALKYEASIIEQKTEDSSVFATVFAIKIAVLSMVLLSVSYFIMLHLLSVNALEFIPDVGPLVSYMSVFFGACIAMVYHVFSFHYIRGKEYSVISRSRVLISIGIFIGQVVFFPLGVYGLIAGQIAGQVLGVFSLGKKNIASILKKINISLDRSDVEYGKKYRRYPMMSFPAVLIQLIATNSPLIVVSYVYGPEVAGLFFVATRIVKVPVSLVGVAMSQVFSAEYSERYFTGTGSKLFLLAALTLQIIFTIVVSIVCYLFIDDVVELFFGVEWRGVAVYVILLMPIMAIDFILSPFYPYFEISGKNHIYLKLTIISSCARMAGLVFPVFAMGFGLTDTIYVYSFLSVAGGIPMLFYLFYTGVGKIGFLELIECFSARMK